MLKGTSSIIKKLLIILIVVLLSVFMALFTSTGKVSAESGPYTIMQPSYDTRIAQIKNIEQGPQAEIQAGTKQPTGINVNLSSHLFYIPSERDQGSCGNCWVWAGTGVMEVAKSVQDNVKDRFSIQYFNSNYNGGTGDSWAGMGGWLYQLADFYAGVNKAIPWTNTNAYYQDAGQSGNAGTIKYYFN